ncbi:MAG: alpha/beta fold hydrolase [Fusobacteriaceae bacterium]
MRFISKILTLLLMGILSIAICLGIFWVSVYPLGINLTIVAMIIVNLITTGIFTLIYVERFFNKYRKNTRRKYLLINMFSSIIIVAIFLIPANYLPLSLNTKVAPTIIELSTKEKLAIYIQKPVRPEYYVAPRPKPQFEIIKGRRVWVAPKYVPILFVNGGPGSGPDDQTFDFLEKFTKLDYDVYSYDTPGYRYSQLPKDVKKEATIDREVDRIIEIMNYIKADKIYLVAHSYGGVVASRLIAKYPDKVEKFIGIDTSPLFSLQSNSGKKESGDTPKSIEGSPSKLFPRALSLREKTRFLFFTLRSVLDLKNQKGMPFGNSDEIGFLTYTLVSGITKDELKNTNQIPFSINPEINLLINRSLENSDTAFLEKLKTLDTEVLLFHPEYGSVEWQKHIGYRGYLKNTRIITVPQAEHRIWKNINGEEILLRNINAFIKNEDISKEIYMSLDNPFPRN